MRLAAFPIIFLLAPLILSSCDKPTKARTPERLDIRLDMSINLILAPIIDPANLDTLKGKRAAAPRLRKACYWPEIVRRDRLHLGHLIDQAHALSFSQDAARLEAQKDSLIRNVTILERLGCLDEAGMEKLSKGNAPTITRGPYAGEIVTGDHIIPPSVCPELDLKLYNLEFMPLTLNQRKGAKVGQRQIDLAKRWNAVGLLSDDGLQAVLAEGR